MSKCVLIEITEYITETFIATHINYQNYFYKFYNYIISNNYYMIYCNVLKYSFIFPLRKNDDTNVNGGCYGWLSSINCNDISFEFIIVYLSTALRTYTHKQV